MKINIFKFLIIIILFQIFNSTAFAQTQTKPLFSYDGICGYSFKITMTYETAKCLLDVSVGLQDIKDNIKYLYENGDKEKSFNYLIWHMIIEHGLQGQKKFNSYIFIDEDYIYSYFDKNDLKSFFENNVNNPISVMRDFSYLYLANIIKDKKIINNLVNYLSYYKKEEFDYSKFRNLIHILVSYKLNLDYLKNDSYEMISTFYHSGLLKKNSIDQFTLSNIKSLLLDISHEKIDKNIFMHIMQLTLQNNNWDSYSEALFINNLYGNIFNLPQQPYKLHYNDFHECYKKRLLDCVYEFPEIIQQDINLSVGEPLGVIDIIFYNTNKWDITLDYLDKFLKNDSLSLKKKFIIINEFLSNMELFNTDTNKKIIEYKNNLKLLLWAKHTKEMFDLVEKDESKYSQYTLKICDLIALKTNNCDFSILFSFSKNKDTMLENLFYSEGMQAYLSLSKFSKSEEYFQSLVLLYYVFGFSNLRYESYDYLITSYNQVEKIFPKNSNIYLTYLFLKGGVEDVLLMKEKATQSYLLGLALTENNDPNFIIGLLRIYQEKRLYNLAYDLSLKGYNIAVKEYEESYIHDHAAYHAPVCISAITLVASRVYLPGKQYNDKELAHYCYKDKLLAMPQLSYMTFQVALKINGLSEVEDIKLYHLVENYLNNSNIQPFWKVEIVYLLNFTNYDRNKLKILNDLYIYKDIEFPLAFGDTKSVATIINIFRESLNLYYNQNVDDKAFYDYIKFMETVVKEYYANPSSNTFSFGGSIEDLDWDNLLEQHMKNKNSILNKSNIKDIVFWLNAVGKFSYTEEIINANNINIKSNNEYYKSLKVRKKFIFNKILEFNSTKNNRIDLINELKIINNKIKNHKNTNQLDLPIIRSLSEIQESLDDKSVILDYKVNPLTNKINIFKITKNNFSFFTLEEANIVNENIVAFNHSIKNNSIEKIFLHGNYIYKTLIEPHLESKTDKIFIIPHSFLYDIPFNAIPMRAPDLINTKNNTDGIEVLLSFDDIKTSESDWLGLSYEINIYNPTKRVRYKNKTNDYTFLGIGNPTFKGNSQPESIKLGKLSTNTRDFSLFTEDFVPLPETEDELIYISNLPIFSNSKLLLKDQATEANVRNAKEYKTANVISFATHALLSGEANNFSEPGLLLSKGSDSSIEDNAYLSSSEIASLSNNADLVILSACNTGGGQTPGSNSLSGLSASFLASGANQVLVSHWPVNSLTTKDLLSYILELKSNDITWGEAQKLGMQKFFNKFPQYQSPYYWGAFILFGTELN